MADLWDAPNTRYLRRSYRSAPTRLVPAIISCQASACLVMFGIFFVISGCVARFVAGDDSPPSKAFDNQFHNEARKDFAKGPRLVGTILLSIGSLMVFVAIVGFIVAFVYYRNYERQRRTAMVSTVTTGGHHTFVNEGALAGKPGVEFPAQAGGYQYGPGYQAVSQNVVYNATTEPAV